MLILAPASATRETVEANVPAEAAPRFKAEMIPTLWAAAEHYGIDPVGMVAQAAHETGWGNFPGNVKPGFYNTCGLKVRNVDMVRQIIADGLGVPIEQVSGDHPLVHQQWGTWQVGALAHAQHLRAYCNRPVEDLIVDPRYVWVIGKQNAVHWADLGGRWAPSASYGLALEGLIRRLRGEA